jgi:hypothetical protein
MTVPDIFGSMTPRLCTPSYPETPSTALSPGCLWQALLHRRAPSLLDVLSAGCVSAGRRDEPPLIGVYQPRIPRCPRLVETAGLDVRADSDSAGQNRN